MMTTSQATQTSNSSAIYSQTDSSLFKRPTIADLNGYYTDGDSCDQDVFAEMRSNVLLVAGEHYNRRQSRFYKRIRETRELNQEQKLRLTKNHVRKICQLYANNIMSMEPGVGFTPKDENSLHDQKVAELHHSVWQDAVKRYYLEDKMDDWCDSFIQIGEVAVKLFFDPNLGEIAGYEPAVDPEGNPALNEFQQMVPDENKPVFNGEFVFEEVYGFNLLRPPECKDMRKAEWLGIRKMVDNTDLTRRYKDQPEKLKYIQASQDETYVVFDAVRGGYKKSSKQTMIREYYFRPSLLFPKGYFYITTKEGVLEEDELPGGLFPIVFMPFDKIQTTPRGRSPIKTMRPYQAEINRAASKIAEHQITLGDDKLIIQNGTKISAGVSLPGVRSISVTGANPTIMQGRSGEQYLQYMNDQITELYAVMNVLEDSQEKNSAQMDAFALLFRAASKKKKFQRYIKRFEKFMVEMVHLYQRLAKVHLTDESVIWAVGKNEKVNIPEFRALSDTCYEINIEAQADDIETKFGKQLVLNHVLQYVGPKLNQDDVGKLMRQMPYANFDESFDDMTMDYDTMTNDILALDRGEAPPIGEYDNHTYAIKRLTGRMRKPDFRFMSPQVQQNYVSKVHMHQQFEAARQLSIQRAQSGFIPSGGYLVSCQFYVSDPSDKTGNKTRQARVPYQAMEWLIKQLEAQGQGQQELANMNEGALAEIANQMNPGSQRQISGPERPMMSQPMSQPGSAMPGRAV